MGTPIRTHITPKFVSLKGALWCWVAIVVIVICAAAVRWRIAPMPLERDEGEYAYVAQQMLNGVPPYESAYSMKLPGIYVISELLTRHGENLSAFS